MKKSLLEKGKVSEELWQSKKDTMDQLTKECNDLKSRIENLRKELSITEPVLDAREKEQKELEIRDLREQLEALEKEISEKTEELMNVRRSSQDKDRVEILTCPSKTGHIAKQEV